MTGTFIDKEKKLAFVVFSLSSWFGVLGIMGPYLPANAIATSRQVAVNLNGNQLTGHWLKKKGRWHFHKISKISKLQAVPIQRSAKIQPSQKSNERGMTGALDAAKGPRTTASINPSKQRKTRKKALRAALADEIGRWAKIGNRWEWQAAGKRIKRQNEPSSQSEIGTQARDPYDRQPLARWVQRDGNWSFEVVDEQTIIRHI